MTSAPPPAIRAESLSKEYLADWQGRRWRALDAVSIIVPRGATCGLVGPNGSGKTTLLKLLAGLTAPTAGWCEVAGFRARRAAELGRVGYAPESPGFPDFLSGAEYLTHLARLSGQSSAAAARIATQALALAELCEAGGRRIGEYSKGMRQRLAVAQAVLTNPDVVLLDEPAAGLDPRAVERLGRIIRELSARECTVLWTSHFLPQMEELCDRIVMLERGRVLFAGDAAEVAGAGGLSQLYLERITA